MRSRSSEGWKEKSKLSSVLIGIEARGPQATPMRRPSRRFSSSARSSSIASIALISPLFESAEGLVQRLERAGHVQTDHARGGCVRGARDHGAALLASPAAVPTAS